MPNEHTRIIRLLGVELLAGVEKIIVLHAMGDAGLRVTPAVVAWIGAKWGSRAKRDFPIVFG